MPKITGCCIIKKRSLSYVYFWKCRIYTQRPLTCRKYDCRIFVAAGIAAGGAEKVLINQRVLRWKFSYSTQHDRVTHWQYKPQPSSFRSTPTNLHLKSAVRSMWLFSRLKLWRFSHEHRWVWKNEAHIFGHENHQSNKDGAWKVCGGGIGTREPAPEPYEMGVNDDKNHADGDHRDDSVWLSGCGEVTIIHNSELLNRQRRRGNKISRSYQTLGCDTPWFWREVSNLYESCNSGESKAILFD